MSTPDAQRFRVQVQELIVRIITSQASQERMTSMLKNVHRDEQWPALRMELGELERRRRAGEGGSY